MIDSRELTRSKPGKSSCWSRLACVTLVLTPGQRDLRLQEWVSVVEKVAQKDFFDHRCSTCPRFFIKISSTSSRRQDLQIAKTQDEDERQLGP